MNRNSIIANRYDILLVWDVKDGNPNGDPDQESMPRCDETDIALVSGQATQRKIRDRTLLMFGGLGRWGIHIRRGSTIEEGILRAAGMLGITPPKAEPKAEPEAEKNGKKKRSKSRKLTAEERGRVREEICKIFNDSRMFGGVFHVGVLKTDNVDGVVTTMMGRSVYPVTIQKHTLTRVCAANQDQEKDQEMGCRYAIPHAVMTQVSFVNPFHAAKNGATMEDLAVYLECLVNLFETKRSGMGGMQSVRGLYVFRHDAPLGNAPAHSLLERVEISSEDPERARSWQDYTVRFRDTDLPPGVTVFQLEQFTGGIDSILRTLGAE